MTMQLPYKKLLFIVVVLLTIASCFSYKKMSRQNMAYIYNETAFTPKPEFQLYHYNNELSILYFKIQTDDLLYIRDTYSNKLYASFSLKYQLLASFDAVNVTDSITYHYTDTVFDSKVAFVFDSIIIKVPSGSNYVLKINITDNVRKRSTTEIINVRKEQPQSAQNFYVTNAESEMLFNKYFNDLTDVYINCANKNLTHLTVKYYPIRFPIASPPFNVTAQKPIHILPDSLFILSLNNGKSSELSLKKEGIYRILTDSNDREGLTLFRFHADYPNISLPEQMIFTARYLTSRQEFDNMMIQADKRRAIEGFWMDIAGNNKERARQLIRKYYGRVKLANVFFASYHEGWKTDRGMIYIVFGQPAHVYFSGDSENWIYGEPSNMRSLNFMFYKADNSLVDNDYMLSKSEVYRDSWHFAVSNWRR